jgi:hypothetical protein
MELKNNDLVMGSSGRIGDQLVYRQRAGKTIIAKRPKKSSVKATDLQLEVQELFAEAVLYARGVLADEAKKALYQAKAKSGKSAFNLALSDFCKAPEIRKYQTSNYTGQLGDKISIRVIDDFKVEWVRLIIKDSADNLIEEGETVLSDNRVDWIYTATVLNPSLAGTKLIISAADMPGNISTLEVNLD